ncbi:cation:proton antiporter [Streptomyces malaysiense]|uniref:cation:proton antiporter n=1 Tax=Streptomyces malaysiense TaxID=1428626 RepID=UPI001F0B179C|nr:cation:proton antiporter [Streptomyces malaysiense]
MPRSNTHSETHALLGVLLALGSVLATLAASYWWGHHLGRLLSHPEPEQLLLRVLGVTLIVAALAEAVHVSAAVGAFLVGLSLTGEAADRAREVRGPLRDLFAAVFFLAIGLSVSLSTLLPVLPVALLLALVTAVTKLASGWYAARREGARRAGRLRAGTALIARGEFSVVIIGLAGMGQDRIGALAAAYVIVLAVAAPVLTRLAGARPVGSPPPGQEATGH